MSDQQRVVQLIQSIGTTRVFQLEDGSVVERSGGTASWRNNNAGNLKFEYAGSADKSSHARHTREQALARAQSRYAGIVALDQWGNAIFETPEAGRLAQLQLLRKSHANHTVERMVEGYSRDDYSGATHHAAQVRSIYRTADAEGVDLRGKTIGAMTPAELRALSDGICHFEGFVVGRVAIVSKPVLQDSRVASARVYPGVPTDPATPLEANAHALVSLERSGLSVAGTAPAQRSPHLPQPRSICASQPDKSGQSQRSAQPASDHPHGVALHLGDQGPAVSTLQAQLNRLGYPDAQGQALSEDGRFGRRTHDALAAFQQARGLVASGHGDARTQAMLRVEDAQLLTSPAHPDHALFAQVVRQLRTARIAQGTPPGDHDLRVAAALLVQMRRDGLQRADRIELSGDGARVRVVQVSVLRDEPALNRVGTALAIPVAMQESLRGSSAQLGALTSATPALPPPAPRLGHAQAMQPR
jgi:peptidoglycan hydrolase-like protein with peptidoglycan-binding domain